MRSIWQIIKCIFGYHPLDRVFVRESIFGDASRHRYRCDFCGSYWTQR